jgi:hypothetical protein
MNVLLGYSRIRWGRGRGKRSAGRDAEILRPGSAVALNQAKSQDLRENYVYRQTQALRLVRASGKVSREENRVYSIAPKARWLARKLIRFEGRYQSGGQYVSSETPENTRLIAALQQARREGRNAVHALDDHVKQAFPRFSLSMPDVYWFALPRS